MITTSFMVPANVSPDFFEGPPAGRGNENFNGPFSFAGNLYFVTFPVDGAIHQPVSVYMSADNGATWTVQDVAHQPVTEIVALAVNRSLVGSVIQMAMVLLTTGDIVVNTFDCSTNLWGVASAGIGGLGSVLGLSIVVQPTGNRFVFYETTGSGNHISLMQLSSVGVWTGPTAVVASVAGHALSILGAVLDSSGVAQLFFVSRAAGNTVNWQVPISSAAVVGAAAVINPTSAPATSGAGIVGYNPTLGPNGTFAVPVPVNALDVTAIGAVPLVVIGDPVGGWATLSPDPTGTTVPAGSGSAVVDCVGFGAGILVLWLVQDGTGITGPVERLWSAVWNGAAFSAPQLVFDPVASPPPNADPPALFPFYVLTSISVSVLSGLVIGLGFSMFVGGGAAQPQFFALGSPIGGFLTLTFKGMKVYG